MKKKVQAPITNNKKSMAPAMPPAPMPMPRGGRPVMGPPPNARVKQKPPVK